MNERTQSEVREEPHAIPVADGRARSRVSQWPLILIMVAACVLILANLGNIYLWQDEAQTALISKTILAHGVPLGADGVNFFSQEQGKEYGPHYIWRWHTWLPFYVLALFFKLFGTSNFVCRLPFALFGIATIFMTYLLGVRLWTNRRAAMLGAILLLLSVPFLLLARQCRYYAPMAFFSIAGLYAYAAMLEGRKRSATWLVVSSVLLFHTHYVSYAALMTAVVGHALIFRRDLLRATLISSAVSAVLVSPWVIWLSSLPYVGMQTGHVYDFETKFAFLVRGTMHIVRYVFPSAMLILAAVLYALRRRGWQIAAEPGTIARDGLGLLCLFIASTILCVGIIMPFVFFRSFAAVIPVCCLIMGLILESGAKVSPIVGLAILFLFGQWTRMPQYLYEIRHDYDGPIEGIVQYLKEQSRPDDIVLATHEDLPIKWYTGLRVIGALTGESLADATRARWVIFRRYECDGREGEVFSSLTDKTIRIENYDEIVLDGYPDIMWENREDPYPGEHRFRTDEETAPVCIYEKLTDQTKSESPATGG